MREENVEFKVNGTPGQGYLVRPDTDAPAPGVVVVQEWWGLNAHIKDVAQRFAAQGFVALAPDLYHGLIVTEPDLAQKEAMKLDRPRAIKEISSAARYLVGLDFVQPKHVAVIGFCMGGGLALHSAIHTPEVGAVAAFYGGGSPDPAEMTDAHAAILNIVGENDTYVVKAISALEKALTDSAYPQPHELVIYPSAEHAFFNDTRTEVHQPASSQDAWQRTLNWFHSHLN